MEEETTSKTFTGILVVNWKNGFMKFMKRRSKKLSLFEIPIEIKLKMNIPTLKTIQAEGEITIPPIRAKEMFIHSI